jgi:hypothetical protein
MNKLPHWMQWCVVFCAFTGFAFWVSVAMRYLGQFA